MMNYDVSGSGHNNLTAQENVFICCFFCLFFFFFFRLGISVMHIFSVVMTSFFLFFPFFFFLVIETRLL